MRRITKILSLLLCVIVAISVCTVPCVAAYAFKLTGSDAGYFTEVLDYVDLVVANGGDDSGTLKLGALADATGEFSGTAVAESQLFVYNGSTYLFNAVMYKGLTKRDRKAAMNAFYEGMEMYPFSVDAKQKISNALSVVSDSYTDKIVSKLLEGTKADAVSAVKTISDWVPKIRIVFGVIVIIAAFGFVYLLVADMLYVNITLFQALCPPDKEGFAPFTRAARNAVAESLANSEYKSAFIVYWKKQWVVYVIYLLILSLAVTGGFSDLFVKIVGAF